MRQHLARDHHSDPAAADHLLRDNPALDDLTRYLQRLKNKVSIRYISNVNFWSKVSKLIFIVNLNLFR